MIMLESGDITSASSSSSTSEVSSEESEGSHIEAERGELLVTRRCMGSLSKDFDDTQRENLFHTRCLVQGKVCSLIIDGGSCTNVVSSRLVEKLALTTYSHPHAYKLYWLSDEGEVVVDKQILISFTIGKYQDDVLCDVIPMESCHILLGRPWQFDKHAIHDGFVNSFSFDHVGRKVTLISMSPKEIIEDQKKLREKIQKERKTEKVQEKKSDKKKIETENKVERKISEKEEKNKEIKKQEKSEKKSEQRSGKDECSLVKRKESLLLERRVLIVRKPYDLNIPNISCLSFHDIGTPPWPQKSLLEFGKVPPMEEAHGLPLFKGLGIGKFESLLVPTNSLLVDYHSLCRNYERTPPKKELKLYNSSSIALVPKEELFIKEQWARQFGEDIKLPRSFGLDLDIIFKTSFPSFSCDIDVQTFHNLFYDSKLKITCALIELDASCAWHWWRLVRDSCILPWQIHVDMHVYLNFGSYIPICLKNDLHVLDVRKEHVLLFYDLNLKEACLVAKLEAKFDWDRWRPKGILIPCHFHPPPSLHACLYFESYAPLDLLDLHTIMNDDFFIWVYDPGINKGVATKIWVISHSLLEDCITYSSLVSNLSIAFVGNDDLNLWANSSQEGGYDGGPSWRHHTLDEGPSMSTRRLTRSMTK